MANTPLNPERGFVDEAIRCLREVDVDGVMVWGPMRPVPYLRRAFPDKVIAYAQRYFELSRASPRYYEYCDYVVCQSEGTARSLFHQEFAIHGTVVIIPNGVDLDVFRPLPGPEKVALRRRLGLPEDSCVVLFPSKLNRMKGTSYLFNWLRASHGRLSDVYFVVAGRVDGLLSGDTRELVNVLEAAGGNVRWLRGVPSNEMPPWYQAADLSLLPGVWREGMSMAAVESLAAGLPIIATRRGIYPEIVSHGWNGWLCRPEALFREGLTAIETLARDGEMRRRLSANARAYAEKRLSRRRCLDNFRAFFEGRLLDIDSDLAP